MPYQSNKETQITSHWITTDQHDKPISRDGKAWLLLAALPFPRPRAALRAVYLNNIFDDPSADWAAGVELLLQLKTTGVAEAHVSAGVDHRVHLAVKANGAFPVLAA